MSGYSSRTMFDVVSSRRDQPTTWRLYKSITTAKNNQPLSVAIYVMSPTQTLSGSATVNSRLSRFGEIDNL
jgi:hypothetical protein